jgi:prepilin-type N-terminal cleavage/methylation domain-containing protein
MTLTRRRRGFTLLEVLLASAIAVILLGALYVAFDLTLRQTEAGRDAVAQGDLSRAITNRMAIDFAGCLGPMPPKSGGGISTESNTVQPSTSTPSTTTPSTTETTPTTSTVPSSASSTDGTTDTTSSTASDTETTVLADVPFQGGVFGSSSHVTLFVSRVPPGQMSRETVTDGQQLPADLMRVTYYLSSDGRGLCRQVRPFVTADGVRNNTDPDRSTETGDVIADEVTGLSFEYLDAGTWTTSWDGSQVKTDGRTATGPPRAIKAVITFTTESGVTKQFEHVFPVRAAVGLYIPPEPEESTGGM